MAGSGPSGSLTWIEVLEEQGRRLANGSWRGPDRASRDDEYTPDEVVAEVRLIIDDCERFHAERPDAPLTAALGPAEVIAGWRDVDRPRGRRDDLGHLAGLFAWWLVQRADRGSASADMQAVQRALNGDPGEAQLAQDLREFVQAKLDGSIDAQEFLKRLNKPRQFPRRTPPKPRLRRAGAYPLDTATATLRQMLGEVSDRDRLHSSVPAWEVYKRFAQARSRSHRPVVSMKMPTSCWSSGTCGGVCIRSACRGRSGCWTATTTTIATSASVASSRSRQKTCAAISHLDRFTATGSRCALGSRRSRLRQCSSCCAIHRTRWPSTSTSGSDHMRHHLVSQQPSGCVFTAVAVFRRAACPSAPDRGPALSTMAARSPGQSDSLDICRVTAAIGGSEIMFACFSGPMDFRGDRRLGRRGLWRHWE